MEEAFFLALIKFLFGWAVKLFGKIFKKKPFSLEEIKRRARVLFVDDESVYYLISNINQAGWNVSHVSEITNFDSDEIRNADIIFLDYKNVGVKLTPTEEGIGLLKVIRKKYPEKHLIFYSGYAGFIPGHEVHGIADDWIQKNSDPYVYINRIEDAAKKIYGKK